MNIKKTIIIKIVIQKLSVVKKNNSQNRGKINEHIKNRRKTDLNLKLVIYMRNRLYKTYKAQNVRKTKKT